MDKNLALNPNRVVSFLGKEPKEFTLNDMITFVEENEIKMTRISRNNPNGGRTR